MKTKNRILSLAAAFCMMASLLTFAAVPVRAENEPPGGVYTVTFEPNGGTVDPASAQTGPDGKLSSLPTPVREGYVFKRWAFADGSVVFSYSVFTEDTTIYATWTGKAGNAGDGAESEHKSSIAGGTISISGSGVTISAEAAMNGPTAALGNINAQDLKQLISAGGPVVLDTSEMRWGIREIKLPVGDLRTIAAAVSANNGTDALTVKLAEGSVTLDAEALSTVVGKADGRGLTLYLDEVGIGKLMPEQQAAVKDMEVLAVYDLHLSNDSNMRISQLGGGSATISIPAREGTENAAVWYVAGNGEREKQPAVLADGALTWQVGHFSFYVLTAGEAAEAEDGTLPAPNGAAACEQLAALFDRFAQSLNQIFVRIPAFPPAYPDADRISE